MFEGIGLIIEGSTIRKPEKGRQWALFVELAVRACLCNAMEEEMHSGNGFPIRWGSDL